LCTLPQIQGFSPRQWPINVICINDCGNEKIKDIDVIKEREKYLDLDLKEYIQLIAIDVSKLIERNISPLYIIDFLSNIIISSNSVLFNEYIVMIVSRPTKNVILESELAGLEEFLNNNEIFYRIQPLL